MKENFKIDTQARTSKQKWTAADIPPQAGKLAVVTGSTSGLGFETALALARAGADVVLAGRNESHGREAVAAIRPLAPAALVRFERLELDSLASVCDFAERLCKAGRPVDLLVNSACGGGVFGGHADGGFARGTGAAKSRTETSGMHGTDLAGSQQLPVTSFLGHFTLTARLLPLLWNSRHRRVVNVSGAAHRRGTLPPGEVKLDWMDGLEASESRMTLAALMFALELQRRSDSGGWGLLSVAAQPGLTGSGQRGPRMEDGGRPTTQHRLAGLLFRRTPAEAARPILFAATAPEVTAGGYYGPTGPLGLVGPPGAIAAGAQAQDADAGHRLWTAAERMTGVKWTQDRDQGLGTRD